MDFEKRMKATDDLECLQKKKEDAIYRRQTLTADRATLSQPDAYEKEKALVERTLTIDAQAYAARGGGGTSWPGARVGGHFT